MKDILKGEFVRLSAIDPKELGKSFSHWNRDSEFMRFLDSNPSNLRSQKNIQKMLEQELEDQKSDRHWFTIRALVDDKLLGDINLSVYNWTSRDQDQEGA